MPFFVLFFLPVYGRVPVPAVGFPRANGCECVGFGRSTGERAPPCARIIPLFSFLRKRKGSRCGSVTPRLVREPRKARPRFLGTPRRPFRSSFTTASPLRYVPRCSHYAALSYRTAPKARRPAARVPQYERSECWGFRAGSSASFSFFFFQIKKKNIASLARARKVHP